MPLLFGRESETLAPSAKRPIALCVLVLLAVGFTLRALWLAANSPIFSEAEVNRVSIPLAVADSSQVANNSPQRASKRKNAYSSNKQLIDPRLSEKVDSETQERFSDSLSVSDYMMLTTLCPTGAEALPAQLLPENKKAEDKQSLISYANAENNEQVQDKHLVAHTVAHKNLDKQKTVPTYKQTATRRRYDSNNPISSLPSGRITGLRLAALPQSGTISKPVDEGWLVSPEVWFGADQNKQLPSLSETTEMEPIPVEAPSNDLMEANSPKIESEENSSIEPYPSTNDSLTTGITPSNTAAAIPDDLGQREVQLSNEDADLTEVTAPSPMPIDRPEFEVPLSSQILVETEDSMSAGSELPNLPQAEINPAPSVQSENSPIFSAPRLNSQRANETDRKIIEPAQPSIPPQIISPHTVSSQPVEETKTLPQQPASRQESSSLNGAQPSEKPQLGTLPIPKQSVDPTLQSAKSLPVLDLPTETVRTESRPSEPWPVQNLPAMPLPKQTLPKQALPELTLPTQRLPVSKQPSEVAPERVIPRSTPTRSNLAPPVTKPSRHPVRFPSNGANQQRTTPLMGSPHAPNPAAAAEARKAAGGKSAYESHRDLYLKNNYPSARECAECHKKAYEEWSISSHAYAYISPMFHKFEQKITDLSQGTVGHFCTRCHAPVTASMGLPRSVSMGELAGAQREGVTCIVCHRVNERYGKTNGDRRIVPGSIEDPVYGGIGGEGVLKAIANRDKYKVKTSSADKKPGQVIHNEGRFFDQLSHAEACTSCHQVAVHPGVKLEVVWEQYRASPACKKGITCQECHMGRVPGVAGGYNYGPIAEVGGKTVNDHRKQSNHTFYGPGYSIAHPGLFPQHEKADRWTINEWLAYDWRAGWGTEDFEEMIEKAEDEGIDTARWFPSFWSDPDDRYDAREIVQDNQTKLARKRRYRELVMENGSKVDGPFFRDQPRVGRDLKFDYVVANLNEGHNLPTASLGAQPQLWANVVLIGPDGRRLWETGYTDSKGDLCDIHSEDVRNGRAPFDSQLFNLQTMFLITGATGTDREFYLPVNLSIDQVAQLRPGALPITVLNHPPFIRMESRSLAPLGQKRVKYKVPSELVRKPGRYRLSFRLRSRTEPMFFMRFCESTQEMMRAMTEGTLDIHSYSVEFEVQ